MFSSLPSVFRFSSSQLVRCFSNAYLGNELQRDLRRLYLLVHPDVMSSFPETVRTANKNSLQVSDDEWLFSRCWTVFLRMWNRSVRVNREPKSLHISTPFNDSSFLNTQWRITSIEWNSLPSQRIIRKMRRRRVLFHSISLCRLLLRSGFCVSALFISATVVGPILRRRWVEFVTRKMVLLLNRSGVFCFFFG